LYLAAGTIKVRLAGLDAPVGAVNLASTQATQFVDQQHLIAAHNEHQCGAVHR
jgi:hypothetical protein